MIVIGITGPTGAGKTTALRELEKLGGRILDADALYHQILESNFTLRGELEHRFGPMTRPDGSFDRKRLGNIVFQDAQAMDALNAITHRYVDRAIRAWLDEAKEDGCPAGAVDAIRLLESGLDRLCDVTLAITAPPEIRVSRIMAREGISQNYAWARVKAQQPDEFYTAHCSYQLVNDCQTAQEFEARAARLWQNILAKR